MAFYMFEILCCSVFMEYHEIKYFFVCQTCGRQVSRQRIMEMDPADRPSRTEWMPTVPHPLVEIDRQLRATVEGQPQS